MMKHKISFICAACCLPLILSGCGSRQNASTAPSLITVKYDGLQDKGTINLSELFEEPEFIVLDSRSTDAYISDQPNALSDNYIGISGGYFKSIPYKLYDRNTGEYLGTVGNIGRGPGEYNRISFAQIDETGGKIWISTLYDNKIHTYDISTGRFLEDLPLAYEAEGNPNQGYNFMVDGSAQTVTIATTPFDDGCPVIAWCQDYEGNVLWEIPKTRTIPENAILSLHTSLNVDGALDISQWSMNTQQDTLFVIEDRELHPLLTMELGRATEPNTLTFNDGDYMHEPCILPDYVLVNISQIKMVTSRNTGSGASISLETDLLPAIVLDRRTGKVSRRTVIDDILTMNETSPSFKCGYLAESYSPEYFIETTAKALEEGNLSNAARKRISTILENLSDEDNNVILLAPIK